MKQTLYDKIWDQHQITENKVYKKLLNGVNNNKKTNTNTKSKIPPQRKEYKK